jgi:hypothetical protein
MTLTDDSRQVLPRCDVPQAGRLTEACFGLPKHALLSRRGTSSSAQYRVRWLSDDVSVRNDAAPVTVQLAGFSCSLSGETLIAEPPSDYSSVDAARAALEPALHAWEASSELDQGLRFSFKYTGSAVHDVASSQQRAVAIDDGEGQHSQRTRRVGRRAWHADPQVLTIPLRPCPQTLRRATRLGS